MKSNEWYTPAKYIEAARSVMGDIDLDPASCALANETVKATRYYTKEENGLMLPWSGRVWLNPPYGKSSKGTSNISAFIDRLQNFYMDGKVEQAIILSTCAVYTRWFRI